MTTEEIMGYQFAERIKAALIIGSKMLLAIESLKEEELKGAKTLMFAFIDALSAENALALNVTGMDEFRLIEEKLKLVRSMIETDTVPDAHAMLGSTVTSATTACAKTMQALVDKGLL